MLHNNIKQSLRTNEKNDISPPCKPTSGGQVSLQLHPGRENQKKNLPVPTECNNRQSEIREKFFLFFFDKKQEKVSTSSPPRQLENE